MNHLRHNYSIHFYRAIREISNSVWSELNCSDHIYFHADYLQSIEENNSQLDYLYVVVQNSQNKAIAFSSIQILDFYLDDLNGSNQGFLHTLTCFGRKLKILPDEKPLKILNCGNPFVSGEHGIFIKPEVNQQKVLRFISKEILKYSQKAFNFSIDIYIMKDFVKDSLPVSNELISQGYYAFNVEPNMKLYIPETWESFDDYLQALKTKFRVKAKKALKLSDELEIESISSERFHHLLQSMTELYLKVSSKASFNLAEFRLKTYKQLKEKLGDSYILQSYSFQGKLVGFLSGVINQKTLDAHFVGIDYELNRRYGIYQRMLYDYIQIAIDNKLKIINFGRTASEIKSSVGAVPEHLTIYIRHKKTITNKFLRLFLQRIQPTEFNQKYPFKKVTPVS